MKLRIDISKPNTIKKAIKALETFQKTILDKMVDELLYESCEAIKDLANERLGASDLNSGLISEIRQGWEPPIKLDKNKYLLRNVGRGYMIEFGVGAVGEGTYNTVLPNVQLPINYEYNIPTQYKNIDGSWIFKVKDLSTLDIKEEYVMPRPNGDVIYQEDKTIRTKGQPATMFLYNAILDFHEKGEAKRIWENIRNKYLGK